MNVKGGGLAQIDPLESPEQAFNRFMSAIIDVDIIYGNNVGSNVLITKYTSSIDVYESIEKPLCIPF